MTSRSSRNVLTVVLSLLTLAASPAVAAAEVERPVQGESSNGLFLSYAPEPSEDGALCLVDSGVDENHDTEEGIIERTSVAGDGSSGEDVDTDERHGTSMAMVAGAPRNGWGMVGAWSQLKVVGVRAVQRGEDGFRFEAYRNAIERCRELRDKEGLPIKVVLLALGGSDSPSGRGGGGGSSGGSGGGGSGGGGSSSEGPSAGPPALTPALFAVSSARLSRGRLLVAGRPGGRPSARLVLLPPRPPHAACGAHS